jgi:hypothetical protein
MRAVGGVVAVNALSIDDPQLNQDAVTMNPLGPQSAPVEANGFNGLVGHGTSNPSNFRGTSTIHAAGHSTGSGHVIVRSVPSRYRMQFQPLFDA